MQVQCNSNMPLDVKDPSYPDLTVGNVYDVLGIENEEYYYIVGNEGQPYFYDIRRFTVTDETRDPEWEERKNEGGGASYFPPEFTSEFFLDFHENNPEAIKTFNAYMKKKFRRERGEPEEITEYPILKG